MFGTRLIDAAGRVLWGSLLRLYRGPPLGDADARPGGLIDRIAGVDVHGALLRALGTAGRRVHALDYDWRTGYRAGAAELLRLIDRIDEPVDLIAVSTGGGVVRCALGLLAPERVGRVVYLGAPQLGSFDALACLQQGFRFALLGKRFPGRDAALCQTTFDALPRWDVLGGLDLFDAEVWRGLRLCDDVPGLPGRLRRAQELHEEDCPAHDAIAIGAAHLRTPARMVIAGGVARVPRKSDGPTFFEPGDGSLGEQSLRGLPWAPVRLARVAAHARLPASARVHELIVQALS
jgi:pimeloyl-ACP methyl ester carboxylesterase